MTLNSWAEAIQSRRFSKQALIVLSTLVGLVLFMPPFFEKVIHTKQGIYLNDRLLSIIVPINVSLYIFCVIYSCVLVFIFFNYRKPSVVLSVCALYSGVTWLRLGTIYLFTFEAPEGIIPLNDPFLSFFVYNKPDFVKDLFFSGHVSTLFTLTLSESSKRLKYFFFAATILTGSMLLAQHVHYTLDVISAPFFTYLIYASLKKVLV
jgi:hypothetical protein